MSKLLQTCYSFFTIALLSCCSLHGQSNYQVESQPAALETAAALSNQGILKQKKNGFVYLDVSNDFINSIAPLIETQGRFSPSPISRRAIGAHINVFHESENITPEELNQTFSFEVKEIRSFTFHSRKGLKKLFVIAVHAPELEALREKYNRSPKIRDRDFHITIGKQMPRAPEGWENNEKFSDFNFSEEPTLGLCTEGNFVVVENPEIMATVAKVNAVGQLRLKGNGYAYVKVDNQFVEEVVQQLPLKGRFKKIGTRSKSMGAHLSAIHENEMIKNEIWDLKEAGEWFTFELKELRYVDRKTHRGNKRLWLLAVDAPGLERLRTHYGLKPKLKGYDFHITLGNEIPVEEAVTLPAPAVDESEVPNAA